MGAARDTARACARAATREPTFAYDPIHHM